MKHSAAKKLTLARPAGRGRPVIYSPKDGERVQGRLTKRGSEKFERTRRHMQQEFGVQKVSDADVIDYLVRGQVD